MNKLRRFFFSDRAYRSATPGMLAHARMLRDLPKVRRRKRRARK